MIKLCEIDRKVLAAKAAGQDWKALGMRSKRRFDRVLDRARWRQKMMEATGQKSA